MCPTSPFFNEEVVIFRSEPGASVGPHCGSSNNVVNIHLTLKGASGTSLHVADQEIPLQDGKAVCFDDSFFHSVDHSSQAELERISLVLRVMHPDMTRASYGNATETDVVNLTRWDSHDVKDILGAEVERLRSEFRQLHSGLIGGIAEDGRHSEL